MTISAISDSRLALAVMLIEKEQQQADADQDQLEVARAERRAAMEQDVQSLREAADSMQSAAAVSLGFSLAGGAAQMVGGIHQLDAAHTSYGLADLEKDSPAALRLDAKISEANAWANIWHDSGATMSGMSGLAGSLVSRQKHHEADAAQAKLEANNASDRVEDAQSHRQKVDRRSEALLDAAREIVHQDNAARDALLRNG